MKTEYANCTSCGARLKKYWLNDGVCHGCHSPELVVAAVVAKPWTPEPWEVYGANSVPEIRTQYGEMRVHGTQANAERVVACVNACAGIENPAAVPKLVNACIAALSQLTEDREEYLQADIALLRDALAALSRSEEEK